MGRALKMKTLKVEFSGIKKNKKIKDLISIPLNLEDELSEDEARQLISIVMMAVEHQANRFLKLHAENRRLRQRMN